MAMASSSSKLLTLTLTSSSSFLRSSCFLPFSFSRRLSTTFPTLRFSSTSTFAAADLDTSPDASVSVSASAASGGGHPWPEWEGFLEKQRSKGYFERPAPAAAATSEVGEADGEGDATPAALESVPAGDPFADQNRVKNACLKFARERFDLLRSLPKQDIQAVVECGCPNLFRKAVNSAKRLRAFLQLDEGEVCGACKLRGSCDKAYVIANAEEGARTVDVVRILLSYAIDPENLAGRQSIDENVQESARKLLSELIMLSDTIIDPSLPKPVFNSPTKKELSHKIVEQARQSVGRGRETPVVEMKKGDWLCPNCNFLNFARNLRCLECKTDGPKRTDPASREMKLGDWICPQCQFMNFARNKKCFKCQEARPKRNLNPGEWECPSCDFVNFRRNQVCMKCNGDRPEDEDSQFGNHAWRKPREAARSSTYNFGDEDDMEDGILPLEGDRKFVVRNRATPAQRKLTAARDQ